MDGAWANESPPLALRPRGEQLIDMELEVPEESVENVTGSELSNYTLDPALCGNVTTEYERVSVFLFCPVVFENVAQLKRI